MTTAGAPKGPPLPSRYDDILDEHMAQARQVLVQAQKQAPSPGHRRWVVGALLIVVAMLTCFGFVRRPEGSSTGRVPFDRASVVSADTLGVAGLAEDFIPPVPRATPAPTLEPARIAPEVVAVAEPARPRRSWRVPPADRVAVHAQQAREMVGASGLQPVVEDLVSDSSPLDIPAAEPRAPLVVNVGTRFRAVLSVPVLTGAASAPVTARLTGGPASAEDGAVPVGSVLVGDAFATSQDDRVQVVFSAMVVSGVTVPVRAIALGEDDQVGLAGRLVRKGSSGKRGFGRVLGAVGSALTLGLVGGAPTPGRAIADHVAVSAASDLAELDRRWTSERSDKVLQVLAGRLVVVSLLSDLRLP
jgi:hypothetical protein